ncbi:gliding motility-associated C-terminal domain-containing protein [Zunongwangia mangrovi]|uniref:Gliding motility-associated C-terminal domain-containing protein n=1 Tax=Zunongwangia mangrovi TaxID=1334022 RepID=A0A1I1FZM7_9FLAO|nr:T9SS type B sorting domain-containing protein [Zunongwangia mangrovi]SFC05059.1 gliding motility-associated C-terminal domain-containing protein [Zunongwangia mangrovi]
MKLSLTFIVLLISYSSFAQLGFCDGSKGDPIFQFDFSGSGQSFQQYTSYNLVSQSPEDGSYTVSSNLDIQSDTWHNFFPQTTESNGNAMIVNASYEAGLFFEIKIPDLCENTTYEFSAFLMNIYDRSSNVCGGGGIPINVRFEIWDETNTELINGGDTGDITSTTSPQWDRYGLTFQTEEGQEKVILKIFNNGEGGCGNDLAIDDIIFRSCGDLTVIESMETETSEIGLCEENSPGTYTLTATPDNAVYQDHFYQWQSRLEGEEFTDIPGATNQEYTTSNITETTYYRVKVAEDAVNLNSSLCSSASAEFTIRFLQSPTPPTGSNLEWCDNLGPATLTANATGEQQIAWYDAEFGGNRIGEGTSFQTETAGIYYAEAYYEDYDCEVSTRTAITLTINQAPVVEDEVLQICLDGTLILDAAMPNLNYNWSTGETTPQISIDNPGTYTVELITAELCSSTKTFEVSLIDDAEIAEINSNERNVSIIPENEGEFEYSLDGINFQSSNTFQNIEGGIYTAFMRDLANCKTVSMEFPHIVLPKLITPNGDGYNDNFHLNGVEYFPASVIAIFDRYGSLITTGNGEGFEWDGSYQGNQLPKGDYWYRIKIADFDEIKGHFSLMR